MKKLKTWQKFLLVIFLVLLGWTILSEYLIQTRGVSLFIDKNEALGVVTNSEGIRDKDLEYINKLDKPEIVKKWLKIIAKDQQEIILHSSDKEWIKANGRKVLVRRYCYLDKISNLDNHLEDFLQESNERQAFDQEFWGNYHLLDLNTSTQNDDENKYCDNL